VPGIIGTEAFAFGNPEMNERMVRRTAMPARRAACSFEPRKPGETLPRWFQA